MKPDIEQFISLADRNFSLIPLDGKRPIEINWQQWCEEKREFKPCDFEGHNAGICCGPASDLIVVDVDDPPAFASLDFSIPETFTVKTAKGFHYYFRYPENRNYRGRAFKHLAYRKHSVFDIRGIGGQVVAPGSIHPDTDEMYEIEKDVPVAPPPDWLIDLLTGGQIDDSPLWDIPLPDPAYHDFLGTLNLPKDKIDQITAEQVKGDRSEIGYKILCSLSSSGIVERKVFYLFDHYPIGQKYREKGKSKTDWLKGEIARAKEFVGVPSTAQNRDNIEIDENKLREKARQILDSAEPCGKFDLSALPSTIRNYCEWICEATGAEPVMVLQSILATASAFISKRFYISEEDYFQKLYPNLWMCTVAPSGHFKTTALNKGAKLAYRRLGSIRKKVSELETELNNPDNRQRKNEIVQLIQEEEKRSVILPNRATVEGLLDHLSLGCGGMIICSELGEWLETLEKKHTGPLKPLLTDFYDVPQEYVYKTRTQKTLRVNEPYITVNAVSTIEWVQKNIKPKDVSSGFFARFLLFYPPHEKNIPPALPPSRPWHRSPEIEFYLRLRDIESISDENPYLNDEDPYSDDDMRLISDEDSESENSEEELEPETSETLNDIEPVYYALTAESRELYDAVHNELYHVFYEMDETTQGILEPYVKRWSPYILKLAMILQCFSYSYSFEIEPKSIIGAKAIIDYAIKSTTHLFKNELGESPHRMKCRKILKYIAKLGGRVKRSKLQSSRVLEGGSKDYDYILRSLEDSGEIIVEKRENKVDWHYFLAH